MWLMDSHAWPHPSNRECQFFPFFYVFLFAKNQNNLSPNSRRCKLSRNRESSTNIFSWEYLSLFLWPKIWVTRVFLYNLRVSLNCVSCHLKPSNSTQKARKISTTIKTTQYQHGVSSFKEKLTLRQNHTGRFLNTFHTYPPLEVT